MRKHFYLIAALMLMFSWVPVKASLLPALDALELAYQNGETLSLNITADLTRWSALSEKSLPTVRDLLENEEFQLDFSNIGESFQIKRAGQPLFILSQVSGLTQSALYLPQQGTAFTAPAGENPLDLLLGDNATSKAIRLLDQMVSGNYGTLQRTAESILVPFGQEQLRKTTLRTVGSSASLTEYKLTAAQWQTMIWPALIEGLKNTLPTELCEADWALIDLQFEKPVTVRRYLDGIGTVMGWQCSTTVLLNDEDERKFSLNLGFKENAGLNLSIKAPATRGRNGLSMDFTLTVQSQTIKADISYQNTLSGQSRSLKGKAVINSEAEGGQERLFGSMWLEEKKTGEQTERLTLTPDFILINAEASGTLQVKQERGGKTELEAGLHLSLKSAETQEAARPQTIYRIEQDPELASEALKDALMPLLRELLITLPMPQRMLLLHDMGRTQRTQGEILPPMNETGLDYIVTEDSMKEVFP